MKDLKCNKKFACILGKLGYTGELTYLSVALWLYSMSIYIMPLPIPHYRWKVGIVYLGESRHNEGGLDTTLLNDSFTSILSAIKAGVEYVVKSLYDLHKEVEMESN